MEFTIEAYHHFANHGKTPALVKSVSCNFAVRRSLDRPIVFDDIVYEFAVSAGGTMPPRARTHARVGMRGDYSYIEQTAEFRQILPLVNEAGEQVNLGDCAAEADSREKSIWFYGRIIYNDVFGDDQETRFCWKYDIYTGRFQQDGDEGNRRT